MVLVSLLVWRLQRRERNKDLRRYCGNSARHSLEFSEICSGPISGTTFLQESGKDTEVVL